MATGGSIVAPRVPFTDPSGIINREWFVFLNRVVAKIGGTSGNSLTSSLEDLGHQIYSINDATASLVALTNNVADLQRQLSSVESFNPGEIIKRMNDIELLAVS